MQLNPAQAQCRIIYSGEATLSLFACRYPGFNPSFGRSRDILSNDSAPCVLSGRSARPRIDPFHTIPLVGVCALGDVDPCHCTRHNSTVWLRRGQHPFSHAALTVFCSCFLPSPPGVASKRRWLSDLSVRDQQILLHYSSTNSVWFPPCLSHSATPFDAHRRRLREQSRPNGHRGPAQGSSTQQTMTKIIGGQ